jgi:hypothetical protein
MDKFCSDDLAVEAQTQEYGGSKLIREHFVLTEVLRIFSQSLQPIPSYCLDWAMNDSFYILSIRRVAVSILKPGSLEILTQT